MKIGTSVPSRVVALLLILAVRASLPAQSTGSGSPTLRVPPSSDSPATVSVDARLVNLPVSVRDKKGALIPALTTESFDLQVDGKPQAIRYFNQDKNIPLIAGLLVDTSMSQRDALADEQRASKAFLDDLLNAPAERDKAFVVQFARQVDLLQDVTGSKPKLEAAVQHLETVAGSKGGSKDSTSGVDPGNGRSSGVRGGTTLYDAVFLSSGEVLAKQKGRKAIIILSDGNDRGSKESVNSAIEAAQRADTTIYTIYFKGRQDNGGWQRDRNDPDGYPGGGYPGGGYPGGGYPGGGYPGGGYPGGGYPGGGGNRMPRNEPPQPDGKKVLEHMAKETGGRLFELKGKDSLTNIYAEIGEELRSQYRLAFTPDKAGAAEGFHTIDLRLTKLNPKDYVIQTRSGYYSGE